MDLKPIEGIPVRQLLLSPVNLLHQLTTALLPGVLAIFLLMLKHSRFVPAALAATIFLGYRTKMALASVVAFVIGRTIQSVVFAAFKLAGWSSTKLRKKDDLRIEEDAKKRETQGVVLNADWQDTSENSVEEIAEKSGGKRVPFNQPSHKTNAVGIGELDAGGSTDGAPPLHLTAIRLTTRSYTARGILMLL